MPLNTAQQRLGLAETIIFGFLLLPSLYAVFRHGKLGQATWPILASICILALVHGVLHVAQHDPNGFGIIMTSTGIVTTLIFVPIGVVSEVSAHLQHLRKRVIFANLAILHILTTGLITIAVIGTTGLHERPDGSRDSKPVLERLGYIGLMVVLLFVLAQLLYLLFGPIKSSLKLMPSSRLMQMQKLLYFTIASVPFTVVRLLHQIIYAFELHISLDPERGSFTTIFVAVFLMQLAATTALVIAGLVSRSMGAKKEGVEAPEQQIENREDEAPARNERATFGGSMRQVK